MSDLARQFRALHPAVEIVVESGGSGRGVSDALSGKADIGMASLEVMPRYLGIAPDAIKASRALRENDETVRYIAGP